MTATRFAGHAIVCRACGRVTRAATLLVAQQKDLAHQKRCTPRAKQQAEADAAKAAQGDLFGGG